MDLLTPDLRAALRANAVAKDAAERQGHTEPDPAPVVKLFNPIGAATWLVSELDGDGDTLFGLADLGVGCPELSSFSLADIAALRLPLDVRIERDLGFTSLIPVSIWADTARRLGSISDAEAALADAEIRLRAALAHLNAAQSRPVQLPPIDPDGG